MRRKVLRDAVNYMPAVPVSLGSVMRFFWVLKEHASRVNHLHGVCCYHQRAEGGSEDSKFGKHSPCSHLAIEFEKLLSGPMFIL